MEGGGSVFLQSVREMKETLKARVRVRVRAVLHPRTKRGAARASAASLATTFAVTRVFKGNIVLARLSQSLATKAARERLQKGSGSHAGLSGGHTNAVGQSVEALRRQVGSTAAAVTSGAALVVGCGVSKEPSQAEALLVNGEPHFSGRDSSAQCRSLSLTPDGMLKGVEEAGLRGREVEEQSGLLAAAQAVVLPLVANMCYVFMHGLNRTEIYGAEKLLDAIRNRPKGQALVTVCNHVAAMDDPLVLSAMVPPHMLLQAGAMRWTLCATDRCFKNAAMSAFFRSVKVLPLKRGEGVDQKGMDMAVDKLQRGEWVHLFPEGSRSRDGGRTLGTIKRGIGRLLTETEPAPLLLPFLHSGMQRVLAVGSKMPTLGNKVTVLVGDPIEVQDLIEEHRQRGGSRAELYDAIAARVSARMTALKEELEAKLQEAELPRDEPIALQQRAQGAWDADLSGDCRGQGDAKPALGQGVAAEGSLRSSSSAAQPTLRGEGSEAGVWEERGDAHGQLMDAEGAPLGFWGQEGPRWKVRDHYDRSLLVSFAAQGLLSNESSPGLSSWNHLNRGSFGFPRAWRTPDGKPGGGWWGHTWDGLAAVQRVGLLDERLGVLS